MPKTGGKFSQKRSGVSFYCAPQQKEKCIPLRIYAEKNFISPAQIKRLARRGHVRITKFKHGIYVQDVDLKTGKLY